MALTTRHILSRPRVAGQSYVAAPCTRTRSVVVRAGLGDVGNWLSQGVLKTFVPAKDNGVNWKGTESPFVGRINRERKPFKDGLGAKGPGAVKPSKAASTRVQATEQRAEQGNQLMDYIGGALARVVGHNFKGDATEPNWEGKGNGFKGAIRNRKSDGFHNKW